MILSSIVFILKINIKPAWIIHGLWLNQEVTLSPEEETEFWSAVGGSEITKERLKTVLARIQHEDR